MSTWLVSGDTRESWQPFSTVHWLPPMPLRRWRRSDGSVMDVLCASLNAGVFCCRKWYQNCHVMRFGGGNKSDQWALNLLPSVINSQYHRCWKPTICHHSILSYVSYVHELCTQLRLTTVLMQCSAYFSFFVYLSFWAVVSAFLALLSSRHSATCYNFMLLYLYLCW